MKTLEKKTENIMEITAEFFRMTRSGEISLETNSTVSVWDQVKAQIPKWAVEFETEFSGASGDDYLDEIDSFARKKILEFLEAPKVLYVVNIEYSWKEDEPPKYFSSLETAWSALKGMAMEELMVASLEHNGKVSCNYDTSLGSIIINYEYDDTSCRYFISCMPVSRASV